MAPYVDDDDVIVLSSDTDEDQAPQPRSVLKTSSSNTPKASAAPRNAKRKLDAYTTGNDGRSISEGRDSGLGADEEDTNMILDSDGQPQPTTQRVKTEHPQDIAMNGNGHPSGDGNANANANGHLTGGRCIAESTNAKLKGRRRFRADIADLVKECGEGFVVHELLLSGVTADVDEGQFAFTLCGLDDDVHVALLVSDTSDYPTSHTFFASSDSPSLPSRVSSLIEDIASYGSCTIQDTLERFLSKIAGHRAKSRTLAAQSSLTSIATQDDLEDDDDEGSEGDMDVYYSDDDAPGIGVRQSKVNYAKLQHDHLQTLASSYRPGFIKFTDDAFSLSLSTPIISLSSPSLPPATLHAWDRRLLSRSQHLVLLISGWDGVYPYHLPAIGGDGGNVDVGRGLKFKVGLSGGYKPSVAVAKEATRKFGTLGTDPEEEMEAQRKADAEAALLASRMDHSPSTSDDEFEPGPELEDEEPEEEEDEDPGRFERFALSGSLEGLMDGSFLRTVQLRRRFGLGWAGAEALGGEVERRQVGVGEEIGRAHV